MRFRYDKENEELVISNATRIEYHQMDLWLTRHVKGYKYMPAFKMGIWNGKNSYFKNGKVNLGLWKECFKGCLEIGSKFEIENKEDFPINREVTLEKVKSFCDKFFSNHKVKDKSGNWIPFAPYDHQVETAYKILKNRYCLSEVATSGGKSLIISIVFFYTLKNIDKDAKFLLIVPSITLVTQFYDDLIKNNYGELTLSERRDQKISSILSSNEDESLPCDIRVEEVMSDKPRVYSGVEDANIYIGTYQSLEKWPKEFFKQFHTISCDESHMAKGKTINTILSRTFNSAYSRFGVSGTFPPDDSCEILTIQSVIGPKVNEVTASELKDKGIITPMDIKVVLLNHGDSEFNEKISYIRKSGDGRAAFQYEKDFIHVSDRRVNFIKKITEKATNNTLILFHTIEYGKKLFDELSKSITDKEFFYIDGEVKNNKRNEIKEKMDLNDGKPRVLVASFGTLSTGVSIKNLYNLILADSFKSEQLVLQSIGRILRLHHGKTKAIIFDIVDVFELNNPNNIHYKHFKERKLFYEKRKYPYTITKINLL